MSGEYGLFFTFKALEQLNDYLLYVRDELKSPQAARNIQEEFERRVKVLSVFPEAFTFVDFEPWRSRGLRRMMIGNLIVYYLIEGDSVTVHQILYSRSNQASRLNEDAESP